MVEKKTNFLLVAVAIVAIAALAFGAVALNKANMTGNAFWDLFKKAESNYISKGLLGNSYVNNGGDLEKFKSYKVEYDDQGNLMYEVIGGNKIIPGEEYSLVEDDNGFLKVYAAQGGGASSNFGFKCSCNSATGCSGSEEGCKRISLGGSGGTECNKDPNSNKCSGEDCKCKERWHWAA